MSADPADGFLAEVPTAQREVLTDLVGLIRAHFPGQEVRIEHGFPVWIVGGEWTTGVATRKKGPMFYMMDQGVLDEFEPQLGRLRSGRSCVEYRETSTLDLGRLRVLVVRMLRRAAERKGLSRRRKA